MGKTRDRIPENKLLKAMAELEDAIKGDALQEQDPEGGLSTEGEPLSDAAPSGRGERAKKSSRRSSASSPFGSQSSSSASASSEDDDDDDEDAASAMSARKPPPPPKKSKKVSKAAPPPPAASSSSSEDDDDSSSGDSGSGDSGSGPAEKSFRGRAENDETLHKAIVVNEFLEALVDQLSLALLDVSKSIKKSFDELESRLTARIDDRVTKSTASQHGFNVRLAKAISMIGTTVQDLAGMSDMVKSIADQPAGSPRGKAVLSKGEINQPPWGGPQRGDGDQRQLDVGDMDVEALRGLSPKAVGDWLFKKAANSQIDPNVILAFEADRYDPAMLPSTVRKALAEDLLK